MKKPKTKKPPREVHEYNNFLCCGERFAAGPEIKAHLKEKHGLEGKIPATRSMTLHLDCSDSWTSNYEWKIGDLVLQQSICRRRAKDDYMRMGE